MDAEKSQTISQLRHLQNIELYILRRFADYCVRHGLSYQLAYGTLLGCVRHSGFIPWDDDVDVCVPWKDYEGLLSSSINSECEPLFFQAAQTDPFYTTPFAKIRLPEEILVENGANAKAKAGVFIDIFPIIDLANNRIVRAIQLAKLRLLVSCCSPQLQKSSRIKKVLVGLASLFFPPHKANKKLLSLGRRYSRRYSSSKFSVLMGDKTPLKKEQLFPATDDKFEGFSMKIPGDANGILTSLYGDYKKLPDEEKRVPHHNFARVELTERWYE